MVHHWYCSWYKIMERSKKSSKLSKASGIVVDFGLNNESDDVDTNENIPNKCKLSQKNNSDKVEKKTIISNKVPLDDKVKKEASTEKVKKKKPVNEKAVLEKKETNETNDKVNLISVSHYEYKPWNEMYPSYVVKLNNLYVDYSWKKLIESEMEKDYFKNIYKFLELSLTKTDGKIKMYPYPELVFSAFNHTPLNSVKVVILGQDPYINNEVHNDKVIPQGMGLSFSVPNGIKIPPSLLNIFKNQEKYGHIKTKPDNGNLTFWADQGVLMLNTALTVQHGYSNSHGPKWQPFTDSIIKYLSDNKTNLVFVLWGSPSLGKLNLIDETKHKTIISSHPSGLSCNKPLRKYPAFVDFDHFGEINSYLKQHKKRPIIWDLN